MSVMPLRVPLTGWPHSLSKGSCRTRHTTPNVHKLPTSPRRDAEDILYIKQTNKLYKLCTVKHVFFGTAGWWTKIALWLSTHNVHYLKKLVFFSVLDWFLGAYRQCSSLINLWFVANVPWTVLSHYSTISSWVMGYLTSSASISHTEQRKLTAFSLINPLLQLHDTLQIFLSSRHMWPFNGSIWERGAPAHTLSNQRAS